jgi:hypothetical protein
MVQQNHDRRDSAQTIQCNDTAAGWCGGFYLIPNA